MRLSSVHPLCFPPAAAAARAVPLLHALQRSHARIPARSARCWDRLEPYTVRGRDLAAAGHLGAAMACFTRAANAVQDER